MPVQKAKKPKLVVTKKPRKRKLSKKPKPPKKKARVSKKKVVKKVKPKKKPVKPKKLPSKRSILRGRRSPWIYFCRAKRDDTLKQHPEAKFGDICRYLGPVWRAMTAEEKRPYVEMSMQDKTRYDTEKSTMDPEKKKMLNRIKLKQKRLRREKGPKASLSAYMFFVIHTRPKIATAHPDFKFVDIGKKLGEMWSQMDDMAKAPYVEMSKEDKMRYQKELAAWPQIQAAKAAAAAK